MHIRVRDYVNNERSSHYEGKMSNTLQEAHMNNIVNIYITKT